MAVIIQSYWAVSWTMWSWMGLSERCIMWTVCLNKWRLNLCNLGSWSDFMKFVRLFCSHWIVSLPSIHVCVCVCLWIAKQSINYIFEDCRKQIDRKAYWTLHRSAVNHYSVIILCMVLYIGPDHHQESTAIHYKLHTQ